MQQFERKTQKSWFAQPLDRVALGVAVVLSILIGILLMGGSHTAPKVRYFTWQDRQIGAEDTAFILSFSRPMEHATVEENLRLIPPLPGKFSWAGRRMAYTLDRPAPYGTAFELELAGAQDRFSSEDSATLQPFVGRFRSRDRAFVYLGVEGDEAGRLVLENLTRQEHQVLTPPDLVVMDFEPYPNGDRILFSATPKASYSQNLLDQQLYTVTTGIQPLAPARSPAEIQQGIFPEAPPEPQPAGQVEQILDSAEYQNLKFDLAPDGEKIIVRRVNRQDPSDFGIWLITPEQPPQPLETEPGGDFLIAPDSNSLAMSQGQGLAILPLESGAEPLDFLAKFGVILSFSRDGTSAATVQFNIDPVNPTRSLYVVTNQGEEKELLRTNGSILNAEFGPAKENLYALVTERIDSNEVFLEQPYLISINLETKEPYTLLKLPIQREIQMSLAPDGLGLLFDQVVSSQPDEAAEGLLRGDDGSAIATSRLWFLPLELDEQGNPLPLEPQELPLAGLRPEWLP